MKAFKANKQYTITEAEKAGYLAQGYDIIDDAGTVVEHSPLATVPYSRYEAAEAEIEQLKAELRKKKKGEA